MKPLVKICGISNLNFLNEVTELDDISYLERVLQNGSEKAFRTSSKTLLDIRKIIGLF